MRTNFLAVLVVSILAAGCLPTTEKNNVVLGAILDRTGINSELSWGDAVMLAEAHFNLALEEVGYKNMAFRIAIRDSAGLADSAVAEATKLVKDPGKEGAAKGLLLATSDEDVAVHKLYYDTDPANDLQVPLICASCTSSSINSPTATSTDAATQAAYRNADRWNLRGIMSTKLIAKVMAMLVIREGDSNHDGKLKVSFYGVNDTFGTGAKKDLDTELKAQLDGGLPYVLEEVFHPREIDTNSYPWSSDVAKLVDTYNETTATNDGRPDVIVSANLVLQESGFTKALKESGTTIRALHFQTFRTSSALRPIAQLAEGEEGVSHLLVEQNASGDVFKSEFQTAFGTPIVYRDAIYYDSAMFLMLGAFKATLSLSDPSTVSGQAIRDGLLFIADPGKRGNAVSIGTGKDEVKKAIAALQDKAGTGSINYEGASGPMDHDANLNVTNKLAHFAVRDGQFVDIGTFDCVASAACPLVSGE